MASMEARDWWADVQQDRDELEGPRRRPAASWLDEEMDFVPARVLDRPLVGDELGERRRARAAAEEAPATGRYAFVRTPHEPVARREDAAPRREDDVEAGWDAAPRRREEAVEAGWDAAPRRREESAEAAGAPAPAPRSLREDLAAIAPRRAEGAPRAERPRRLEAVTEVEPPQDGPRRITITGNTAAATAAIPSARRQEAGAAVVRREREALSARDRMAYSPDRLALWAVMIGFLLIVLAVATSDASAAAL